MSAGLSPLARGTLPIRTLPPQKRRFIPAGAGNSWRRSGNNPDNSVYPRWRGELIASKNYRSCTVGLSPLARGTRKGQTVATILPPVYPRWRGELSKHNLLLINDFLSQSQSTNFTGSHKQHIHYVKEHLIH